jgi:hypothetical protein
MEAFKFLKDSRDYVRQKIDFCFCELEVMFCFLFSQSLKLFFIIINIIKKHISMKDLKIEDVLKGHENFTGKKNLLSELFNLNIFNRITKVLKRCAKLLYTNTIFKNIFY